MYKPIKSFDMKTFEIIAYRTLQFSSIALGAMFFVAVTYAVVQLVTGNYTGTACRTF